MPYNTTAIPPRTEATGHTQLPLSRVKKVIAVDPDINICSNNAAFVITLAAEMFVQHLTAEASAIAKAERKPRRNIQYKDMANAVAHNDNLEFLEDVVPRTVPLKDIRDRAAATRAKLGNENKAGGGPGGDGAAPPDAAGNGSNGKNAKRGEEEDGAAAPATGGKKDKSGKPKANGFMPRIVGGADREDRMSPDANDQLNAELRAANSKGRRSMKDDDGDIDMEG